MCLHNLYTVGWVSGLLTCKNRRPYNLYCVGGDVKPCTIYLLRITADVTQAGTQLCIVFGLFPFGF